MVHHPSTTNTPDCRIAIVGNAGGGKTTLSQKLGKKLSIPIFHIDDLQWDTSWKKKPTPIFQEAHNQLMKLDNWVIDGVGGTVELYERLRKANIIIFVDLPVDEHLRLAKEREKTPTATAPRGCSYADMSDQVTEHIKLLDATLIPKLRKDIPKVAKITGATVYTIKHIKEIPRLLKKVITICK